PLAVLPAGPVYYVSGQAERGKTLTESTRKTLASLDETLRYLKCTKGDVVQIKAFVHPMSQIADVRKIRGALGVPDHYGNRFVPPSSLVGWTSKASIEIELVVAAKPTKEKPTAAIEFLTPPGMKASPVFTRVTRINHGKRLYTSGIHGTGKD